MLSSGVLYRSIPNCQAVWRGGDDEGPGCRYLNENLIYSKETVTKYAAEPEFKKT